MNKGVLKKEIRLNKRDSIERNELTINDYD